jgi:hypothetical protein
MRIWDLDIKRSLEIFLALVIVTFEFHKFIVDT